VKNSACPIKNMTSTAPKTFPQVRTPLLIKELATALGVSTRFIYQMRACGFPMTGDTRQRQKATLAEARAWISANNFRLNDGKGVTDTAISSS
jgi:hypothetical protein